MSLSFLQLDRKEKYMVKCQALLNLGDGYMVLTILLLQLLGDVWHFFIIKL